MNDLTKGLQSNLKLFADDTSSFSTVQDITTSTVNLNNNLTFNGKYNVRWILILILTTKLNSYYLAEKQVQSNTNHWVLMTI